MRADDVFLREIRMPVFVTFIDILPVRLPGRAERFVWSIHSVVARARISGSGSS